MVLAIVTAASSARASGSGSHLGVATDEPAEETAASAADRDLEPRADRAVRTESTEWYGAPIIALDVAALALTLRCWHVSPSLGLKCRFRSFRRTNPRPMPEELPLVGLGSRRSLDSIDSAPTDG